MSYLEFKAVNATNKLREQFISQAQGLNLATIIKNSKGLIKLCFYQPTISSLKNVYLVMVVGINDGILIKFANQYAFPRGFPIIWNNHVSMQYFGFYPKFSNDERQTMDDISEFDNIIGLEFFKKWSGFLGQLIVFEIDNNIYWTVTSKNSADNTSIYVQDAKRLFEPLMTTELIDTLIRQQLHICAEIISLNDQVHGTKPKSESVIVTAIGKGQYYNLTEKIINNNSNLSFVDFLDNNDLVAFCINHKLPCDSAIIINNADIAINFMTTLSKNRDFMTDNKLDEMVKTYSADISVRKGTINHFDILGNCLEGLVIKLFYPNSSCCVRKYKFAGYTIRTLLLRQEFENFVMNYKLITAAKRFVNGWCVSDIGREYWYNFAMHCFLLRPTFIPLDTNCGIHIQVADIIQDKLANVNSSPETISANDQLQNMIIDKTDGTVIICVGPIGSGKTTFVESLCSKAKDLLVPIDGDDLGLGMDTTMKLGSERNDYSRWLIMKILMAGQVPVISTGGAVMIPQGKIQTIQQLIYSTVKLSCRIIVCLAGLFDTITELDNDYDTKSIYQFHEPVKKAVLRRIKLGQWRLPENKTLDEFIPFITKKSADNCQFANKLIVGADIVFGFPVINEENYGIQNTFDFTVIISNVISVKVSNSPGKFTQIRLLTMISFGSGVDKIGHITWLYDANRQIDFTLEQFKNLHGKYEPKIGGTHYIVKSLDKRQTYEFVCPIIPIHDDKSTHITINSGLHMPKETRTIVLAILDGKDKVDLPTKDNKIITYDLANCVVEPCEINVLASFGI